MPADLRSIVFDNASASAKTTSWKVDRASVVKAVSARSTNAVFSKEPLLTWATFIAPTVTQVTDAWRLDSGLAWTNLDFSIAEGQVIYCAFTNIIGSAILHIIDEPLDPFS